MAPIPRTAGMLNIARPAAAFAVALFFSACAPLQTNRLVGREQVVFFPSAAAVGPDGAARVHVQGRVFEPADGSLRRRAFIAAAAAAMKIDPANLEQSALFHERLGAFISDSEGGKTVTVRLGQRQVTAPPSDPAGFFATDLELSALEMRELAKDGRLGFESVPAASGNQSRFAGEALAVPADGTTVITDIDDTIKITNMRDPHEKMANTLYRPFQPVPGMAELFQAWKRLRGPTIHFHVVSAGPWQLQPILSTFFADEHFPQFTWDMRSVDVTAPQVLLRELHPDPYPFKVAAIGAWIARFPRQRLILVGDSGEKDPEVFAHMLAQFSGQIDAVCIRNVTQEPRGAARYARLFGANEKVRVFADPAELRDVVRAVR